jgi:hypothetical protein
MRKIEERRISSAWVIEETNWRNDSSNTAVLKTAPLCSRRGSQNIALPELVRRSVTLV